MKLFKAVNNYCKIQVENEVESVRKGILIVDDSKFSRNILKDILKAEGYLVVGEAGDGLEAIDMAHEKKPEYIFMDVEMPKLDGIAAIPKILELDPDINIVMCTALGQKKIMLEAAKAGAKDYVIKPYMKENIISVLNIISDKKQNVIPFKSGKKNQDDVNNIVMDEKQFSPEKKPDIVIEMEEFLAPLEYEEDNIFDGGLDSFFDDDTLLDNIDEEILDSYMNEELPEKVEAERKTELEDAIVCEETVTSDPDEIDSEAELEDGIVNGITVASDPNEIDAEAELEDVLANEVSVILDADMAEEESKLEDVIANEVSVTSDADEAEEEAELEDVIANEVSRTSDADVAEEDHELEDVIANEVSVISDADVAEEEAKLEDDIANEVSGTSDSDEAEEEAELEDIIANEVSVTTDTDDAEEEAKLEEAELEEAELEEAITNQVAVTSDTDETEEKAPDIISDDYSMTYTYLWNNRFDILQKEINVKNTMGQRVSFYEYAYLENDRYDLFGKDYTKREMVLGMMNAYMSLDNRFQQKDNTTYVLGTLTYAKETRLFTSNILEEINNKSAEITIANEIKYNSLKPKQKSQEITNQTGLYQVLCEFVNGKSGRVLR